MRGKRKSASASPGRHERDCKICRNTAREQIEADFCSWEPISQIVNKYHLGSRAALYRHAKALDLFPARDRNLAMALGRFIEKALTARKVPVSAAIQAIGILARLNRRGQIVSRTESEQINSLFDRMSMQELEAYAASGKLPEWAERELSAERTSIRSTAGGGNVN